MFFLFDFFSPDPLKKWSNLTKIFFQPPLGLDNSRSRRIRDVTSCLPMGPIFPKPQRLKTRWTWALEKQKKTVSRAVRSSRWGLYQLSIVNLRRNSAPNMKRILLQMVGKKIRGTTALGLRKKQTHIIRVVVSNMFLLLTIVHGEMIQFDAFIFFNWVGKTHHRVMIRWGVWWPGLYQFTVRVFVFSKMSNPLRIHTHPDRVGLMVGKTHPRNRMVGENPDS